MVLLRAMNLFYKKLECQKYKLLMNILYSTHAGICYLDTEESFSFFKGEKKKPTYTGTMQKYYTLFIHSTLPFNVGESLINLTLFCNTCLCSSTTLTGS